MPYVGLLIGILLVLTVLTATYAVTLGFWFSPAILTILYFYSHPTMARPNLGRPSEHEDQAAVRKVVELVAEKIELQRRIDLAHESASNAGVRLTEKSAYTRYDARSRSGQDANRILDLALPEISRVGEQIEQTRAFVLQHLRDWRAPFDSWARKASVNYAFSSFVTPFSICMVAFAVMYVTVPGSLEFLNRMMLFKPILLLSNPLIICAVFLAYAVLLFYGVSRWRNRDVLLDDGLLHEWKHLIRRWSFEDHLDNEFTDRGSNSDREHSPHTGEKNGLKSHHGQAWHEVLGVPMDASIAIIREAYIRLAKQYHPDRVQALGEKLKQVAEQEMRAVNRAYAAALRERGVSQ